jgi:hypothetical protein
MTPKELLAWQRKRQASAKKAVTTAAKIRRNKERQRAEEEKQRAKENPPVKNQPKFHFHFEEDWERDGPPQWVLDCWKEMKAAKIANSPPRRPLWTPWRSTALSVRLQNRGGYPRAPYGGSSATFPA